MLLRIDSFLDIKKSLEPGFVQERYNSAYGISICYVSGMIIVLLICLAELFSGSSVIALFSYVSMGVAVLVCLLLCIVLVYTYKYHYWCVFGSNLVCEFFSLIVFIVFVIICIYSSSYARGCIFSIISQLSPVKDIGSLHTSTGILPSLESQDPSLERGYATLTTFAQQSILNHQGACSGRTFIVANLHGFGLSALMHYYGIVLGKAMEEGKIFSWGESACSDFFGGNCRDFFMDEHNCTGEKMGTDTISEVITDVATLVGVPIPSVFRSALIKLHPSMSELQLRYWWRTQSATYLMRFNSNTLIEINSLRKDPAVHPVLGGFIPPKTVNIQMRRGDKYDEMNIPSVQEYIDQAAKLFNNMPFSYSRWVFITGDDMESLVYADKLARDHNWGSIYSNFPRMGKGFVLSKMKEFGWNRNITLANLMDLDMSSDCDAWIGTRSSGWSRLFDEFRCTKVPKCSNVYIEMGLLPSGQYSLIEI